MEWCSAIVRFNADGIRFASELSPSGAAASPAFSSRNAGGICEYFVPLCHRFGHEGCTIPSCKVVPVGCDRSAGFCWASLPCCCSQVATRLIPCAEVLDQPRLFRPSLLLPFSFLKCSRALSLL